MGFRDDSRFHCSEAFRQNWRAWVPYHDSVRDWDRGVYYFPEHSEHSRSLSRLVSMRVLHEFSSDIPFRFLAAQSYAGFIVFFAWVSTSIPRPPSKRAVALAFINAFSQLGNVAGSYVWPSVWGPTYRNSYAITLSCFGLGVVMTFIFREYLRRENLRFAAEEQKALAQSRNMPHERQECPAAPVIQGETGFRYLL
jgi:MFS family permease